MEQEERELRAEREAEWVRNCFFVCVCLIQCYERKLNDFHTPLL